MNEMNTSNVANGATVNEGSPVVEMTAKEVLEAKAERDAKTAVAIKIEANVRPIEPRNNLVAYASIRIADSFVVDNIKLVAGEKGIMVDMPSIKGADGKYHDIAFPITAAFRTKLNETVIGAYTTAIEKVKNIGEAQKEYAQRPGIMAQIQKGAAMAAAREATRPQPGMAAKQANMEVG